MYCTFKSLNRVGIGPLLDLSLICGHFTGHQTLFCKFCGSFSYSTSLCSKTAMRPLSQPPAQPSSAQPFLPWGQLVCRQPTPLYVPGRVRPEPSGN